MYCCKYAGNWYEFLGLILIYFASILHLFLNLITLLQKIYKINNNYCHLLIIYYYLLLLLLSRGEDCLHAFTETTTNIHIHINTWTHIQMNTHTHKCTQCLQHVNIHTYRRGCMVCLFIWNTMMNDSCNFANKNDSCIQYITFTVVVLCCCCVMLLLLFVLCDSLFCLFCVLCCSSFAIQIRMTVSNNNTRKEM